jgi:hypothetical protein
VVIELMCVTDTSEGNWGRQTYNDSSTATFQTSVKVERCTSVEYMYFPNPLFAILNTSYVQLLQI